MNKIIIILIPVIFGLFAVFGSNTVTCEWQGPGGCTTPGFQPIFSAHNIYSDSSGHVLSSNIQTFPDSNYNRTLCCNLGSGTLNFTTVEIPNDCPPKLNQVMFLTGNTNARIGYNFSNPNFNINHYSHKLCGGVEENDLNMDLRVIDSNQLSLYEGSGYTCLYRTSSDINGHVSSCAATFGTGQYYNISVVLKIWDSVNQLRCSSDCTSRVDGRVYHQCGAVFDRCKDVHLNCNGALLGSWVNYNTTTEVQCSPPWNNFRTSVFTDSSFTVTSTDKCSNLINREYQVMLDNELVTMHVYICNK